MFASSYYGKSSYFISESFEPASDNTSQLISADLAENPKVKSDKMSYQHPAECFGLDRVVYGDMCLDLNNLNGFHTKLQNLFG